MSDTVQPPPLELYQERLAQREQTFKHWSQWDQRLATSRGLLFLAGLAVVFFLGGGITAKLMGVVPITIAFFALVIAHHLVARRMTVARRSRSHYETCCNRVEGRWVGVGSPGKRYASDTHPYAEDLDLFGEGSLFQLINLAQTRVGEDRLAEWISHPASVQAIQKRQDCIRALAGEIDLREQFGTLDAEVHEGIDQGKLSQWTHQPTTPLPRGSRIAAWILGTAAVIAALSWVLFRAGHLPLLFVLLIEIPFLFALRRRIRESYESVEEVGGGLRILSNVLQLIEEHRFEHPYLQSLQLRLQIERQTPSVRIAQLDRSIQSLTNCMQNQFFAPFALLLCLPVHLIHRLECWRIEVGPHIADWLDVVSEVEALSSLAGFRFDRPDYVFPEVVEGRDCFEAQQIGHPLIPADECVRNDVRLGEDCKLMMISGSNMSGKSTLLRTIGVNAALALAGAPCCADSMCISQLQLGTAMRVSDSLQDGKSLFYAVISRLKAVVDLSSGERTLLFLLDEILQGTNSHDRRIGAEGVIQRLLEQGAMGLVTTHDLALTEIVDHLPAAENNHFEDRLVDGRMEFDYRMRPGVVRRSNALELMRMMGLRV